MLQRWALQLSIYDYNIEFACGSQILQADFLSHHFKVESGEQEMTAFLIQSLPIDKHTLDVQTKKCYGAILHALKHSWSLTAKQQFREFYVKCEELSMTPKSLLCYKELIAIPPGLREKMLESLHMFHIGNEKMKSLA